MYKDDTDIIRSEMLIGRECHSIHTTVQRVPWSADEQMYYLIWKAVRSISSVWRLSFTYTGMCKSVLEQGRESRKASWGISVQEFEVWVGGKRVILYRGNSTHKGMHVTESWLCWEKPRGILNGDSGDKTVRFCGRQLRIGFICHGKSKENEDGKGNKFKSY